MRVKAAGIGQHLGAGLGERAVERGKAQIIADRQADRTADAGREHRFMARHDGRGFAVEVAVVEIDIEHVDLVVARGDRRHRAPASDRD